nr:PREDICTED: uncharacterized protein LOC109033278 isoform X2 [Bemisia tabaci]
MCPWIPLNQLREVFLLVPIVICAKPRFNMQIEPPPPLRNAAEIDAAFREHEIIPDLLSKAPKYTLEVAFHREYYVDFGNYIVPAAWEQKPTKIHFAEAKKGSMYVLIMTGLDFPTRGRPRGREWWYWVFGDLVVGPGLGRKGKTVMAYIGPSEMKIYSGQTKSKEDSMRQITMKLPYHELFIKGTPVLVTFPIFLYLSIKIITADPLKKTPQEIESALKKFKIIPDVLDVAPKKAIKIYYETEVFPDFGNELNAEDCATEPYMMEWGAEEEKYYLFVMVDPDYASQNDSSQQGQYEHSVVGNIQFENLQRGTYMSDYHGPNPQPNTGSMVTSEDSTFQPKDMLPSTT